MALCWWKAFSGTPTRTKTSMKQGYNILIF